MAAFNDMHITPDNTGLYKVVQTEDAAKKVTELLSRDMKAHHVFFNNDGFHNHIPHHILTLYGTGAEAKHLQQAYDGNTSYQRPAQEPRREVLLDMTEWDHAKKYLGREKHYADFLAFYRRQIENLGWERVLKESLFKGDERADDMLVRMFAGFLHPLIQLMYGVEWRQGALVAEGLAQASVHKDEIGEYLVEAERRAKQRSPSETEGGKMGSILSMYEAVAKDEKLAHAVRMSDGNKLSQGVMVRAKEEMLEIAARVKVLPEELEERTAEMFHAAVLVAASAAAKPGKSPKFDFFLIHHVNAAPIFLALNSFDFLPAEAKARILEWKIRMDLAQYAARAIPPISINRIRSYEPRDAAGPSARPIDIVSRLHALDDDGHAIKLARAAAICQEACAPFGDRDWMVIRGEEDWLRVHHMAVDSVQGRGAKWVRTTGLDEAWKDVEDAPRL